MTAYRQQALACAAMLFERAVPHVTGFQSDNPGWAKDSAPTTSMGGVDRVERGNLRAYAGRPRRAPRAGRMFRSQSGA